MYKITHLADTLYDLPSPKISGNNVVWTDFDGTDLEIYLYNGSTTLQLTNNASHDKLLQISGNNAIWSSFDGNDTEIYLYNGSTTLQLTNNTTADRSPQISGNNVVWVNGEHSPGMPSLRSIYLAELVV